MDKSPKIGKNARDIFAPTVAPAAASRITTPQQEMAPATTPSPAEASLSAAVETARETNGRGRPPLHQEPVSKITTVLLNRHVVYLDGISNEIRQQSGAVVKRSEILRALVEALEAAKPELDQVRSQADLTEILRARLER